MSTAVAPAQPDFNDLMLTMDVVDNMRRAESELQDEADSGKKRAAIKEKLASLYRTQGIEVSDAVLEAGVAARFDNRFAYHAPTGPAALMARAWIARARIGIGAAIAAGAILVSCGLNYVLIKAPHERQVAADIVQLNAHSDAVSLQVKTDLERISSLHANLIKVESDLAASPDAAMLSGYTTPLQHKTDTEIGEAEQELAGFATGAAPHLEQPRYETSRAAFIKDLESRVAQAHGPNQMLDDAARSMTVLAAIAGADQGVTEAANALAQSHPDNATQASLAKHRAKAIGALASGDVGTAQEEISGINHLSESFHFRQDLATKVNDLLAAAKSTNPEPTALAAVNTAYAKIQDELASQAPSGQMKASFSNFQDLVADLSHTYQLRVVNRPGERTGVWRYLNENHDAKSYYLVVEAIDPSGAVLSLPITNEETQETSNVHKFAVHVAQDVYEAFGRDKQTHSALSHPIIGQKRRGALQPEFDVKIAGGYITSW